MKKRSDFTTTLSLVCLFLLSTVLWSVEGGDATKKMVEKKGYVFEQVNVVNVKVPVRVFHKGTPVDGLKKSDFKIFENGKERPINGFFVEKKKLRVVDSQLHPVKKSNQEAEDGKVSKKPDRLFLLIFNISSDNNNVNESIDQVFKDIIRPGDRIIVLTNSSIIQEQEIKDVYLTKNKIKAVVKKDIQRITLTRVGMETNLNSLVYSFMNGLGLVPHDLLLREYYQGYLECLEETRWNYFSMTMEEYFKVADYLRKQDCEKWVLNFYQTGFFPEPKTFGKFKKIIDNMVDGNPTLRSIYLEYEAKIHVAADWRSDVVTQMFLKSGATFHTMLIKPRDMRMLRYFMYRPVSTQSENILRTVTVKTGGKVVHSQEPEKFVSSIIDKEDICYVLTYVPNTDFSDIDQKAKDVNIKVRLTNNKNYKVVYHGNRSDDYLNRLAEKVEKENPRIAIGDIKVLGGNVYASISNIKTVKTKSKSNISTKGRVEARVLILSEKSKPVFEKKKYYACKKSVSLLIVKHPPLPKGHYDVIVEVKDLNTWKSDMNGVDVTL